MKYVTIVVILITFLFLGSAVNALTGWTYSEPIYIQSNVTLMSYHVLITIDTATLISNNNMKSDCGDMRFTDTNHQTLLRYWIESGCNTLATKVWVKVPSITAYSTKIIYLDSGNPSATSASSGAATFIFFDDFASSLGKWIHFGEPTPERFADSEFHDGYGYATEGDISYPSGSYSSTLIDISDGISVRFRVKQKSGSIHSMFYYIGICNLQAGYTEKTNTYYFAVRILGANPDNHPENSRDIRYYAGGSNVDKGANDQQFHIYDIVYDESSRQTDFYQDGNHKYTRTAAVRPFDRLPLFISGRDKYNTNYLDYIFVRKYAASEPAVFVGSEPLPATTTTTTTEPGETTTTSVPQPASTTTTIPPEETTTTTEPAETTTTVPQPASTTTTEADDCHSQALWGWEYCTTGCKCDEGEGDCDEDADCKSGLICKDDVGDDYDQDPTMDICEDDDVTTTTTVTTTTEPGETTTTESEPVTTTTISDEDFVDINVNSCKDQYCANTSKMFLLGENVYLDYTSQQEDLLVSANLTYPNQIVREIELPYSFKPTVTGNYVLRISASKEDYQSVKKTLQFRVFTEESELQMYLIIDIIIAASISSALILGYWYWKRREDRKIKGIIKRKRNEKLLRKLRPRK